MSQNLLTELHTCAAQGFAATLLKHLLLEQAF